MPVTGQNYYPDHNGVAHDQVYGSDIDRFVYAEPAAAVETTINNHGTGGVVTITFDPLTTRATTGSVDTFGWAIDEADFDSTSTAKRKILAGNVVVTFQVKGAPVASLNSFTISGQLYRVAASPSFARTSLGTGSVNVGLLTTAGGSFTFNINLASDVIFEANETLQLTMRSAGSGQLGGITCVLPVGNPALGNTLFITLPSPGLRTKFLRTLTAIAQGLLTIKRRIEKKFSVTSNVLATFSRLLDLARSFTAAPSGLATIQRAITKAPFNVTSNVLASVTKTTFKAFSVTSNVLASVVRKTSKVFSVTSNVLATFSTRLRAFRAFTVTTNVLASMTRTLTFRRTFTATSHVLPQAKVCMEVDLIPDSAGGGTTIIKKTYVFDD